MAKEPFLVETLFHWPESACKRLWSPMHGQRLRAQRSLTPRNPKNYCGRRVPTHRHMTLQKFRSRLDVKPENKYREALRPWRPLLAFWQPQDTSTAATCDGHVHFPRHLNRKAHTLMLVSRRLAPIEPRLACPSCESLKPEHTSGGVRVARA